jgi:peptidyl-prolyl cis-trans isomerase A (cyclophilin A)
VIRAVLYVFAFAAAAACGETTQETEVPVVVMETSKGTLRIEMLPEAAPITVANFLEYVESGFYDGVIFHRIVPGFVIQGGGYEPDMVKRPTRDAIQNESDNGVLNTRGTLSMARTNAAHSATSQFFINLVDNGALDYGVRSPARPDQAWGYAVFARVIEGMDVVDEIARVQTGQRAGMADVPVEPVVIQKAYVESP